MVQKIFKFKIFVVLSCLSFASQLKAEPGFYESTDERIPEAVRKAAESVFYFSYKDVEYTIDTMAELEESYANSANRFSAFSQVRLIYLKKCLNSPNPVPCKISGFNEGSIVLAGANNVLFTASHVLGSDMVNLRDDFGSFEKFLQAMNPVAPIEFLLSYDAMVKDEDNKSVRGVKPFFASSDKLENKPKSRIVFTGIRDEKVPDIVNEISRERDFSIIKTSVAINKPYLKINKAKPEVGSTIYLLGYPVSASGRPSNMNSNGRQLFITKGKVLEGSPVFESHGYNRENVVTFDTDADGCNRMSGGAAVDENGALLGIILQGMSSENCETSPSSAVNILSSAQLLNTYNLFN